MSLKRIIKWVLAILSLLVLFAVPPALWAFTKYYESLEAIVVARFSRPHWDIPSRIYSDSRVVYPGQNLDDLGFFQRLARLDYHPVPAGQVTERGEYSYSGKDGALVLFLHRFSYPYREFGGELIEMHLKDDTVKSMDSPLSHAAIYSFELEPELLGGIFQAQWEQRRLVRLSQVPLAFQDAILAAEDHRFYEHHGIDIVRIIKAALVNLTSGHVVQGGSTLTQQLMKNFFLTNKRTYKRKIKEAIMAFIAERHYTKADILENYVNDIYLGQRGAEGIYGIWEASEYYFSKEPRDLTIGEMATIAGMIRSPNSLNPLRHPKAARKRRDEVLKAMLAHGYIHKDAYDTAVAEPFRPREKFTENNNAPYFIEYVKKELAQRYPPSVLKSEGLRIFTTLDVHTEKLAEHAIDHNLIELEGKHPKLLRREKSERLEECLVAVEPQSGKIRAMVGGRDFRQSQFNRVTQSHRQPGSVFKPVTYLAAFNETLTGGPGIYLPTSYIDDDRFTWNYGNMSWTPKNYREHYYGEVTLKFALQESLDAATARLAYAVGLDRIRATAAKLGFGNLPPYPSIILGGVEVTPMQVARAYSIIADGGMELQPYAITAVVDENGKVIQGHEFAARQVLSPRLAYLIQFMMQNVVDHGTGYGARQMGFMRPAAGKTGTTNDSNDAWFAGFTPNLLAVVWTGFDQKEPLGLTGAQASLPAWTAFMKAATASRPALDFPVPPGIVTEMVDPLLDCKATPESADATMGAFPVGLAPVKYCTYHGAPAAIPASARTMAAPPKSSADPSN